MAETIQIDSMLAPDLIEYWGRRCRELTAELRDTKTALATRPESAIFNILQSIKGELAKSTETEKELRNMLQSSVAAERDAHTKLNKALNDNAILNNKVDGWNTERNILITQVQTFQNQSMILASESDKIRSAAIAAMFPPAHFLEPNFHTRVVHAIDIPTILEALTPSGMLKKSRVYLLPKPPSCMPLQVRYSGSHGYWFAPTNIPPGEFELIAEGRAGEWTYLGRYITAPLPGHNMRLAEWMNLDEQSKLGYYLRVAKLSSASRIQGHNRTNSIPSNTLPKHQAKRPNTSTANNTYLEIKRKHDSGEWSAPCYTLQCIGFNTELDTILHDRLTNSNLPLVANSDIESTSTDTTLSAVSSTTASGPSMLLPSAKRGFADMIGTTGYDLNHGDGRQDAKRGKIEPLS